MEFERQELLEPLKIYNYELKYKHEENVTAFFDDLVRQSGVNVEENRKTCAEYYGYLAQIKQGKKKLGGKIFLRVLSILVTVFSFLIAFILAIVLISGAVNNPALIPIAIAFLIIGIVSIVLNCTIIRKALKNLKGLIGGLNDKANKSLSLAKEQMAALNRLYDWNIPSSLFGKTMPLIEMDKNFNVERLYHMIENYGFKPNDDEHLSTFFVQSGELIGNPFIVERDCLQTMVPHIYTGSIVITWVTYSRDSKGRSYPVTHTQTLTATVTEPAAHYELDTVLFYANEAAPRLSFSRSASNANHMKEKDIEKVERDFDKKYGTGQKGNFTPIGNSKFEGLFHALNRDNEVEFRLLFTPLAQKNMLDLILSKEPYGDDFRFVKKGMINLIRSAHAQNMSFDGNPSSFYSFDYDKARKNFINYNMNYMKGIFYDLAPLLSIPLYQQMRDYDYKYTGNCPSYHTPYEAETLANFMKPDYFKPDDCDTSLILKASFITKLGKGVDLFNITAHGFTKIPQVAIIPKLGGDGRMHQVPVHYFIYEPVSKDTPIVVMDLKATKQEVRENMDRILQVLSPYMNNNDIIIQRDLCSFIAREGISSLNANELNKLFSHKED